jgi:hypothetical protein
VVTDYDETGFRVIEYGRRKKVTLPASVKHEMREMGLRDLRRKGIGQHTIERALHGQVRVNSYTKILAALEESKKERALTILPQPNQEVIVRCNRSHSFFRSGSLYAIRNGANPPSLKVVYFPFENGEK